jgi:hypothetical protein
MKPRARRVTIAAAVLGAGVVAVLAVVHWGMVRDHVEAWRFQLTRETEKIEPDPALKGRETPIEVYLVKGSTWSHYHPSVFFHALADYNGCPVISELGLIGWPDLAFENPITAEMTEDVLRRVYHCRVIEQRFPRRAHVVIWDKDATR